MILNNAKNLMLGDRQIDRVYKGGEIVWGLPPEYQRVEYLESTGEQWIDTDFIVSNKRIRADANVQFTSVPTSGSLRVCGNLIDANYGVFRLQCRQDNSGIVRSLACNTGGLVGGEFRPVPNYVVNKTYHLYADGINNIVGIDNLKFSCDYKTPKYDNTSSLALFKSGVSSDITPSKIYNLRITDATMLLLNFIPCYRKSDFKPGMYDTVTKQFFVNKGTGADFIVGSNV